MSRKSTLSKVKRELKRRLERVAQGLPVTNTYSDKLPPTTRWTQCTWDRGGRRIFIGHCKCGRLVRIQVLYSSRKIYCRVVQPRRGRTKKKGLLERNLQKGDVTKQTLQEFLLAFEYMPEEEDKHSGRLTKNKNG